jgi:hypothetical protein
MSSNFSLCGFTFDRQLHLARHPCTSDIRDADLTRLLIDILFSINFQAFEIAIGAVINDDCAMFSDVPGQSHLRQRVRDAG